MKEPQNPEEWISIFRDQYTETGNPVHVLCAFCHIPPNIHGNTVVPGWIAAVLANGFNNYLAGLTACAELTLETAIGIGSDPAIKRTDLDKMADYVHLYRWLFGLKPGIALAAVYKKYVRDITSQGKKLEHQGVTRSGESFSDLYNRSHAKKYETWAASAKEAELTEENRQIELAFLDSETARYIKRNSPHYKSR